MIDDDDEATSPREHVMRPPTNSERREYFAAHPPGTPVVRDLVEQDLQHRVVALERRTGAHGKAIDSLTASRRFWRWAAGLGLPVLLSSSLVIVLYSADKITTSSERIGATLARLDTVIHTVDGLQQGAVSVGTMQARVEALSRLIELLQQDIRDLRSELHKRSDINKRLPTSHMLDLGNKLSLVDITVDTLRTLAPQGPSCSPLVLATR